MKVSTSINWQFENALLFLFALPTVYFFLGSTELGKQLALIIFVAVGCMMLAIHEKVVFDCPAGILAILTCYALGVFFVRGAILAGNIMPNDFAEVLRLFGILMFYVVGATFGNRAVIADILFERSLTRKIALGLFLILAAIAVSYFFRTSAVGSLSKLYSSEEHRFSGNMPGINYIWLPVTVLSIAALIARYRLPSYLAVFALVMTCLILSASFTSIAATFVALTGYWVLRELFVNGNLFSALIAAMSMVIGVYGMVVFFEWAVESNLGVSGKFRLIAAYIESGSIDSLPSLARRIDLWRDVLVEVQKNVWFGHGPAKAILRYTDNTYVMTLFRYGILGLILEVSLYLSLLVGLFYRLAKTRSELFLIPLCVLFAFLVSGTTSNVFYELRSPYLVFFVVGYFCHLRVKPSGRRSDTGRKTYRGHHAIVSGF